MDISARAPRTLEHVCSIGWAALATVMLPVSLAGAVPIQHGLSGSWYQPRTQGEGVVLEIYPNAVAPGVAYLQGSWLTFYRPGVWDYGYERGSSAQRWYTFGGNAPETASSVTFELYENNGGNFVAPPTTIAARVGTVVLSFRDCTNARMDYDLDDQSGASGDPTSGTIRLTRLTPNVTCIEGVAPSTDPPFAHSGHWHDPGLAGQGLFIELNPKAGLMLLAWQTYAPMRDVSMQSRLRWYTGQGSYTPGSQTTPLLLYETTGGLRDGGGGVTNVVGWAAATFSSCDAVTVAFVFGGGSSAGEVGTLQLSRLVPMAANCDP